MKLFGPLLLISLAYIANYGKSVDDGHEIIIEVNLGIKPQESYITHLIVNWHDETWLIIRLQIKCHTFKSICQD